MLTRFERQKVTCWSVVKVPNDAALSLYKPQNQRKPVVLHCVQGYVSVSPIVQTPKRPYYLLYGDIYMYYLLYMHKRVRITYCTKSVLCMYLLYGAQRRPYHLLLTKFEGSNLAVCLLLNVQKMSKRNPMYTIYHLAIHF